MATAEIEGTIFTKESEYIIKAVASGEMSREELIKRHKGEDQ